MILPRVRRHRPDEREPARGRPRPRREPWQTFRRVTLPQSKQAILAGLVIVSLPMFGDYYTNDLLGSPKTSMFGNLIDKTITQQGQGPRAGSLVLILMVILLIPMVYYLRSTRRGRAREQRERRRPRAAERRPAEGTERRLRRLDPQPVAPAAVPAGSRGRTSRGRSCRSLIAIAFSFNDGRSRSVWQGFSMRWWTGDPNDSLFHDPALRQRDRPEPAAVVHHDARSRCRSARCSRSRSTAGTAGRRARRTSSCSSRS